MTVSVKQAESKDFSGDLSCVSLPELLAKLVADGHTGHLEITTPSCSGLIWFVDGALWDATAGVVQGLAAFYRLAGAHQGRFSVRPCAVSRKQNINDSLPAVLARQTCLRTDWSLLPSGVVGLEQIIIPRDRLRVRVADTATRQQRALVQLVDGQRNVAEIVEQCGEEVVASIRTLTSWAAKGWVTVSPPPAASARAPASQEPLKPQVGLELGELVSAPKATQRIPLPVGAGFGATLRGLAEPKSERGVRPSASVGREFGGLEFGRQTRTLFPVSARSAAVGDPAEPPATLRGLPAPIDVEGFEIDPSEPRSLRTPREQTPLAVSPARLASTTLILAPAKESKSNTDLAPPASEPLAPYAELGPYQVVSRLGRGAMGAVYLARLRAEGGPERQFAIKVLRTKFHNNDQALSMLINEARIASQVQHPNVVAVFDVGSLRGQPYLVMEYVCGCTLDRLLGEGAGSAGTPKIVRVVLDCLTGLRAIHDARDPSGMSLGVVHNDLSPRNVLVGVDGVSRLTDFGVAQINTQFGTGDAHAFGTRAYLAPERLKGATGDARSDLFSLGVLLWKGLTGLPLFEAESFEQTTANVLGKPIPPPSSVGRRPPPCFDALCLRALARDPNARFQSAEQMRRELEAVAAHHDLLADHGSVAAWVQGLFGAAGYPGRPMAQHSHVAPIPSAQGASRYVPDGFVPIQHAAGATPVHAGPHSGLGAGPARSVASGPRAPTLVLKRATAPRRPTFAKWAAVVLALVALLFAVIGPELLDAWGTHTEQGVRSLQPLGSESRDSSP